MDAKTMISMDKKYTTRDGRKVVLDAVGATVVSGFMDGYDAPWSWRKNDGGTWGCGSPTWSDLILAPEEVTLWVNVYWKNGYDEGFNTGSLHQTESEAKNAAGGRCITTIPITFKVPQ